jgi:predicted dienelactone hydrolase
MMPQRFMVRVQARSRSAVAVIARMVADMFGCACVRTAALSCVAGSAAGAVGMVEIAASVDAGPVTVFYPSPSPASVVRRDGFVLDVALDGAPAEGNHRLVVISHGSPASPWVHADLARTLVGAGFIVALPQHQGDNHKDASEPGPPSWARRPLEVSRAIDTVSADARLRTLFVPDQVGMYGMSAGGHTALTLAGGRWSPSQLRRHCEAHIADDFHACAGPSFSLTGSPLDGLKRTIVGWVLAYKLRDETWYAHTDPRITAIVAGVPFAADFDAPSLASPRVALGIVAARQDRWLVPRFHSDAVLQACAACERVADLAQGGHGALLSPLPPAAGGGISSLVADPPGFDRAQEVPRLNRQITAFFITHLTTPQGD